MVNILDFFKNIQINLLITLFLFLDFFKNIEIKFTNNKPVAGIW